MENCSKSELLEQHLLREVLPRFRPGERIPSEQEMADRLNTSRTTMHKVYFNLMSRGLIYRRNGVGTFVAEPPAPPKPAVPARMITAVMPSLHLLNAKETPNWFNHQYTLEYFADAAREDNFILNVVFLDHDRHSPDEAEKLLNRADVPAFLFSSLVPEHAPIIERLTAAGKTCVGRYFGRADFCHSVWFDMENAFLLAVKHLAGTGRNRPEADRAAGLLVAGAAADTALRLPDHAVSDVPAGAGTGGAPVHRRALPLLSAEHVRRRVGGAADAGGGAAFRCDSLRHRPACVRRARRAEKSGRSGSGRRRRDRAQQ